MIGRRSLTLVEYLGRGFVVLLLASVAAGATYFAIKATLPPGKRAAMENERAVTASARASQKAQLAPASRAADVWDGLFGFTSTVSVALFTAIIGRHVFRLRI